MLFSGRVLEDDLAHEGVLYGVVQYGGTFEAPLLLSPAPDNLSGPQHDLTSTRRGGSPGAVSENSDEHGVSG